MNVGHSELLDAVLAHPDDDGPRLVFGDWLLERGDDRGELIQIQIRLANTSTLDEHWWELRRRVEALLARNTLKWTKLLPEVPRVAWGIVPEHLQRRDGFERGLMERATFPNCTQFEKTFDELWRHTPVRHVRIDNWSDRGSKRFFRRDVMDRVRGLWLTRDGFDPESTRVPTFFESARPEKIESLWLYGQMLRPEGLDALLKCDMGALRRLEFVNAVVQPEDVPETLLAWPHVSTVESLSLRSAGVRDSGAVAMAGASALRALRTLSLGGNSIGVEGIAALANSANLRDVGHLDLSGNPLGPDGIAALTTSSLFERVRRLDLSRVDMGSRGAAAIASTKSPTGLYELALYESNLDDEAAAVLANAESLRRLRGLDVRNNEFSERALLDLILSPTLESLKWVRVTNSRWQRRRAPDGDPPPVTDEGMARIRERFPHVHRRLWGMGEFLEFGTDPGLVP